MIITVINVAKNVQMTIEWSLKQEIAIREIRSGLTTVLRVKSKN